MSKLDALIINPGNTRSVYQELSIKFSAIEPPIFCGLFANFLRKKGHSAKIIDVPAENIAPEQVAELAQELNPHLIIIAVYGFQPSASTQNMPAAYALIKSLKNKEPNIKVLLTGTHPAALPARTLTESEADFVCTREGPITILELLKALETTEPNFSQVHDLCYRLSDGVHCTEHAPLIKDLDQELPGIAWDLLPMEKYRAHNWHCFDDVDRRTPYASIHTSLGCPYQCTFCCINTPYSGPNYTFARPTYRLWNPQTVIREIDLLVNQFGVRNLKIADEMFLLNESHVNLILDQLIERRYDLNIWAYGRVDTLKQSFIERTLRAGLRWWALGIESGSRYVRDGAQKKLKNNDIVGVVKKIRAAGVYAGCNYIFGLPDDTLETMQETLDLSLEINSEYANFYSAMAYPGSPLYEMARQKRIRLPDDPGGPGWIGYSQHAYEALPLSTDHLSAQEVLQFRDEAFLKYFTHPQYLKLVATTFGNKAVAHIQEMTSLNRLKRKILEN